MLASSDRPIFTASAEHGRAGERPFIFAFGDVRRPTCLAHWGMTVSPGRSFPLGASLVEGGVNFCVFSRKARAVELLLFGGACDPEPARVIRLEAPTHRTYHYWHAFVPGSAPGRCMRTARSAPSTPRAGCASIPRRCSSTPTGAPWSSLTTTTASQRAVRATTRGSRMRSVVVDPGAYDWEGDVPLRRPFATTVIYEMHVAGFTRHPSSGVAPRGAARMPA